MPSNFHKNIVLVVIIAIPFLVIWNLRTFESSFEKIIKDVENIGKAEKEQTKGDQVEKNPLDGCVYVYLDMGTNIGQQIR